MQLKEIDQERILLKTFEVNNPNIKEWGEFTSFLFVTEKLY
jgi:hypothetical protein